MVVFEDILSGDGLERAFLSQEGVVNLEEQVGKRIPLLERRRGLDARGHHEGILNVRCLAVGDGRDEHEGGNLGILMQRVD